MIAAKFPYRCRGVYKISETVCEEFDCISIEADRLEKMGLVPDARFTSQDGYPTGECGKVLMFMKYFEFNS